MEKQFDTTKALQQLHEIWEKIYSFLLTPTAIAEVCLILVTCLLTFLLMKPVTKLLHTALDRMRWPKHFPGAELRAALLPQLLILPAIIFLWCCTLLFTKLGYTHFILSTAIRLLTAWMVIRVSSTILGSTIIEDSVWARLLYILAWIAASLHILKLLTPTLDLLDSLSVQLGGTKISILLVLKGVIVLGLLLKVAGAFSKFIDKRIYTLSALSPSAQVLTAKTARISLLSLAVLTTLGILGVNLSAFAFVSGAIGVGVGFGLQKVVSNLVSGIILLADHSIKPGDVISVGDTYGVIRSLGARFVSVATRDDTEFLIPNEYLITNQVINWSFSSKLVRLKIELSVSYDTDIPAAIDLVVQTASTINRVLADPKPVCQLKDFGDSAIDLELRIWIKDPENGINNVRSDARIAIWKAIKKKNIDIPFPQRDVNVKCLPTLEEKVLPKA